MGHQYEDEEAAVSPQKGKGEGQTGSSMRGPRLLVVGQV